MLLSRFECVRESSAAPRVRFFVRALLKLGTRHPPRGAHHNPERQSATCIRLASARGATAMQIISLSLTRRDCARSGQLNVFIAQRSVFMAPRVNCLFAARREPCNGFYAVSACVCLRAPNHR